MKKILVVGDVHFCTYSSIVRKRGQWYSRRLENLLHSINWVEKTAIENKVDKIIYLGDFFDRSDINAEELTAFREIAWANDIKHYFLIGNHEADTRNLEYSSIAFIEALGENFFVIDRPSNVIGSNYELTYLPYIFENKREDLEKYVGPLTPGISRIIFSHNDLKGVQYGAFESKEGFEVSDILEHSSLFINGHIHNGQWIQKDRILNLGNLTGQNFNEDGNTYLHQVMLLNMDNLECSFLKNPYAFNFVKLEINNEQDFNFMLPEHCVLSVKCIESLVPKLRGLLDNSPEIEEYRIVSIPELSTSELDSTPELNTVDHLKQFQEYIIEQLGNSDMVIKELQEIVK